MRAWTVHGAVIALPALYHTDPAQRIYKEPPVSILSLISTENRAHGFKGLTAFRLQIQPTYREVCHPLMSGEP